MLPLGLVEVSRTGIVAIQRGPEGMLVRAMRWPVRLGVLALIVAAVLGYGYWRSWSRANITLIVFDVSRNRAVCPRPSRN
jgi:hypothetical protein